MRMKNLKWALALVGVLGLSGGLTSCGGGSSRTGGTDELWICVYDGGYGTEWAETIGAAFEEETGIKVQVDADTSILSRLGSALKDGGDYDLYMSHGISWQEYATLGYLEPLDDVYESTVDGYEGTFADRLVEGAEEVSKLEVNGEEHYYKVCWTQGAGGILYNMDMFEQYGWEVPTTYDELVTLCDTINEAQILAYDDTYVKPFAWSGSERQYYWDYPVFEWWAQLAGMDKIETIFEYLGEDGSYTTGYEMYNPDTYYKEFIEAYEMWYDLIAQSDNSLANAASTTLVTAKGQFVTGKAAMMPYAQWAKYELEQVTDEGELDFDVAMMATPRATADSIDVNYMVGFGDSMIVPANAANVDGAKEFIKFMATDFACSTFVEQSHGAFLAFDYTDVDMSELEAEDTYIKSVHEKLVNSTNFSSVSTNPITYATTDTVMPWVGNIYYYQGAAANPNDSTYEPESVGEAIYSYAKSHWATWLASAGLS